MTPRERLYARLAGKPVDKIPNMNIFMFIVAREAGVSYSEYVQNYRKLVEGNLICAEKYGVDSVGAISDPMRETAAFGARVVFPEDACPYAEVPLITDDFDLSVLNRFDPLDSPRTLDRVKACELLRQKAGNDYPVIGWIEGCLAEAADLRGINELLVDLAENEEYLAELFEIIFAQQKCFARAQIDAGADFIGVGNAVASLVGPALYEKYALAWDRAIVDYIHEQGAGVKLHICGNITRLLELLLQVEPDILDVDWMVDFRRAAQMFKDSRTAVSGNFNPAGAILLGSVEQVQAEIRRCISEGTETTLIAGGCEIPAAAPDENLRAMDRLLYIKQ
ncbi:MAG: uroporphyrinogen decarboxylase family protein [Treponema sp.]|jgi:uroporphyrinogen decarboxylase|nr:uroporphyrinogen decarboxylase family protein [Treponema sp.]